MLLLYFWSNNAILVSIRNLFQNNPKCLNGNAIAWIMIDIDSITRYVIQNIDIYI